MKLKDIFLENQNRRFAAVKKIKKENIKLEMKPIQKMKEKIIMLSVIFVAIIGLLLLNFNLKYFLVSILLIFLLIIIFIFGNKSTLECDKNTLNIRQGFQKINIPYTHLKNVYIGKVSGILFFLPAFNYNIVIRYEDNFSFLRELEFSLLCANSKDVELFLDNFLIEDVVEPRYVQFEKRKFGKRIISFIFTLILTIIIIIYILPLCGINLGSII